MGYVVNNGLINLNKPITDEAKEIIDSIIDDSVCVVGGECLEFDEYYDKYFDETVEKLIRELDPLGYSFDGQVAFYGDWEGKYKIQNYEVLTMSKVFLDEVSTEELLDELRERGVMVD